MQIQLANVVKSQEEILLERRVPQAYIKGITIHFLPNSPNALWEALRPGIKAFTPLVGANLPPEPEAQTAVDTTKASSQSSGDIDPPPGARSRRV